MTLIKRKLAPKKVATKRVQTVFKPFVNSRHPSHAVLRTTLPNFPFRALIRLGSTKTLQEAYPGKTSEQLTRVREINSIQGVKNSSSKLLMKQCFDRAQVKHAQWSDGTNDITLNNLSFPIVAKSHYGSRGEGE